VWLAFVQEASSRALVASGDGPGLAVSNGLKVAATVVATLVGFKVAGFWGFVVANSVGALFGVVVTGIRLVHQSMLGLMDTGLPADELLIIRSVLDSFDPQGIQYHALRTRVAGARRFMSVHLLFPGDWTVTKAHGLSEEIEAALHHAVPRINILTHLEPIEDPASWHDIDLDRAHPAPAPRPTTETP
jgi:divalent metal cation (Fe/Co/Zn/Cd) transporter